MTITEAVTVLRRRWWLLVALPVAVVVANVMLVSQPPVAYEARLRFAIDIPRSALVPGSDEGTAAKIGEALIDDIARIIPSEAFAAAVLSRLPEGGTVAPGELASELSATDRHRVADIWVRRTAPPGASATAIGEIEADLRAVAEAAVAELEERGTAWFARLGEDNVALTVVDGPTVRAIAPSLQQRIELPLRGALALAAAIGIVFLLHAIDPRLYTEQEVSTTCGATVIGRIPSRHARRWWR